MCSQRYWSWRVITVFGTGTALCHPNQIKPFGIPSLTTLHWKRLWSAYRSWFPFLNMGQNHKMQSGTYKKIAKITSGKRGHMIIGRCNVFACKTASREPVGSGAAPNPAPPSRAQLELYVSKYTWVKNMSYCKTPNKCPWAFANFIAYSTPKN